MDQISGLFIFDIWQPYLCPIDSWLLIRLRLQERKADLPEVEGKQRVLERPAGEGLRQALRVL